MGAKAPSEDHALQFFTRLLKAGLLTLRDSAGSQQVHERDQQQNSHRRWNPFWMQWPLFNPDGLLATLLPVCRWMFHPLTTFSSVLLMAVAAALLWTDWDRFAASSAHVISRDNWLWLGAAWLSLKLVHELSHGLACKHHGGRVPEMGVVFILFAPMAYVDVTSSWQLRSRWQRMHIAAAGMWTELTLAAIALLCWSQTDSPVVAHLLHNVVVMAGVTTILFNLNPLMRFDGYYLLSDWLEIPNLAGKGSTAVRRLAVRGLYGVRLPTVIADPRERMIVLWYGIAAALWRVFVAVGLTLAAAVMWHGAGVLLAAFGVLAWWGLPAIKAINSLRETVRDTPVAAVRCVVVTFALIATIAAPLMLLPNPRGAVAPGVVDYADARHVRAATEGFLSRIHVGDGDQVAAGELLFELTNDELINELRDLEIAIEESEVRRLAAANAGKPGEAQIELAQQEGLSKRRQERLRQVAGLQVRAPRDGFVVAHRLRERIDSYVHAGDELCVIGDAADKEVVLAIDQPMLARIEPGQELSVRTGGGIEFAGRLERLTPRARSVAPHPNLCAVNGGPLANRDTPGAVDRDEPHLVEPVLEARLALEPEEARRLAAGQLCYASTHTRKDNLGRALWIAARKWVADRVDEGEAAQR